VKISDYIYGDVEITEPVILDLISCPSMQRLKGISQLGPPPALHYTFTFARFDHCVGVMLLLRKLGACEEEQVAGLLHDVSHSAFSHVIDWTMENHLHEDFQDRNHEAFLMQSEIPEILSRHGFDVGRISDYHHFPLLEQDAPELCADRVDYAFREFPLPFSRECLGGLVDHDHRIAFADHARARLFADAYNKYNMQNWGNFEAASRYRILAHAINRGFETGVLAKDDIWEDDALMLRKMEGATDSVIDACLDLLRHDRISHLPREETVTVKKLRYVDPLFLSDGSAVRLSDVDQAFSENLERNRRINDLGIYVVDVERTILEKR